DTTGYRVAEIRRRIDRQSPVGFGRADLLGAFAIQHGRIERPWLHRGIELPDRLYEPLAIDPQPLSQLLDAVSGRHGGLWDAIFIAQEMLDLLIEDLESRPQWLFENLPAIGRIGIVAKVCPFIDKPLPLQVDDESKGIGMLLVELSDGPIPKWRGI